MPKAPKSPSPRHAQVARVPAGVHTPESNPNTLGPRHAEQYRRQQIRAITIQDGQSKVISTHPLAQVENNPDQIPTPPDSSDEDIKRAQSSASSSTPLADEHNDINTIDDDAATDAGPSIPHPTPLPLAIIPRPPIRAAMPRVSAASLLANRAIATRRKGKSPRVKPMLTPEEKEWNDLIDDVEVSQGHDSSDDEDAASTHPSSSEEEASPEEVVFRGEEVLPQPKLSFRKRALSPRSLKRYHDLVETDDEEEEEEKEYTPEQDGVAHNPLSFVENCDLIDLDESIPESADIDIASLASTPEGEEYLRFLFPQKAPLSFTRPVYRPWGPWEYTEGVEMQNVEILKCLGEGAFSKGYLKKGTIHGEELIFISKEWNLMNKSDGFFAELILYTSPEYLKSLQGDCIPRIIGMYKHRNNISVAFELPHCNSWIEAHPDLLPETKEKIVEAYQKIHSKGVLHGDVGLRHILIGDDHRVTIIDFNISRAVQSLWDVHLYACDEEDLKREIREVKVKLRIPGAIEDELRLIDAVPKDNIGSSRKRKRQAARIDMRKYQTASELYSWIVAKDAARRMIVPGRQPDLASFPRLKRPRKESNATTNFLNAHLAEIHGTSLVREVPTPVERSTVSLPRRILQTVGSYLSNFNPFTKLFSSSTEDPSHEPSRASKRRKLIR